MTKRLGDCSGDDLSTLLPFLKWAGGKRWLVRSLPELIPAFSGRYYEPFLGSAAVFFSLLPRDAYLADSNRELIDTYVAIQKNWKKVLSTLETHHEAHSKDHYYSVRAQMPKGLYGQAGRFIYLNRVCWNGLYRVNRRGEFNVPIGTKTQVLLESDNFYGVARALSGQEIVCSDFEATLELAGQGDFIFADPPYTVTHKFNGFVKYNENLFSWDDQVRLFNALLSASNRGANVLSTNADHQSIRKLYRSDFYLTKRDRFSSIAASGANRGKYPELLITNYRPGAQGKSWQAKRTRSSSSRQRI
jgi:DNA adenine methylase